MCGLIGFSGKENYNTKSISFIMMSNITRGENATGMYFDKTIKKDTDKVHEFLAKPENKITPSKLFIGHTRKKSVGTNIVSNSHPFRIGNIIGAHNGTLTNYATAIEEICINVNQYGTDSEALISLISFYNEDISKFAKSIYGAVALIWINEKKQTMNLYRNYSRPLFYCIMEEGMYISSLEESFIPIGAIASDIYEVPINNHIVIKDGKIIKENTGITILAESTLNKNYSTYTANSFSKDSYVIAESSDESKHISKGNLYYVINESLSEWTLEVLNDINEPVSMYKSQVAKSTPLLKGSKAAICMKGVNEFFAVNEIIQILGAVMKDDKKYYAIEKMDFDNKVYEVPAIMLRPLCENEINDYQEHLILNFMEKKQKEINEISIAFKKKTVQTQEVYDELDKIIISFKAIYDQIMITSSAFVEEYMEPFNDILEEIEIFRDSLLKEEGLDNG